MSIADLNALLSPFEHDALGQALGLRLDGWQEPPRPARTTLAGRYCRIEPLDAVHHAPQMFAALEPDVEGRNWTYLSYGPFADVAGLQAWMAHQQAQEDPLFFAIVDAKTGNATGVASYLRIDPQAGCIEVGHLNFSPLLQQTPAATEAMYLMMRYAFELGYRRYEWKCNALNLPSRQAALRLGFTFEGLFRQARVVKGRNGDTAWFSVLDGEWPALRLAFEHWLAAGNFDERGRQKQSLTRLRQQVGATGQD